ncbi:MAG: AbrB/MazE/SpoVT family DNA-binding domain-containing protein [Desulfobulbus sp.]|jgi:antitoxin ChpS
MHTTTLRKVGGSVMLTVPPAFLEQLRLKPGNAVGLAITEDGMLVVHPNPRPQYTLAELLEESEYSRQLTDEERQWVDAPAVGKEIL